VDIEIGNLRWDERTGRVDLLLRDGEISLGPLADAYDECPSPLHGDLDRIRHELSDRLSFGRAIAATEACADSMRQDAGRW
jgi:hypothetical protein